MATLVAKQTVAVESLPVPVCLSNSEATLHSPKIVLPANAMIDNDRSHKDRTEKKWVSYPVRAFWSTNNNEIDADKTTYIAKILDEYHDTIAQKASNHLGYPFNLLCGSYDALSPFLSFHLNNLGDPFDESNYGLHSRKFEIGVLNWFAKLWGIEEDEYWGYVTNGGTEGNLHGLLLGRELLPDGVLYASKESHYSIFKAARMYRMDCEIVDSLVTGEIDCNKLKSKLLRNRDRPAIINLNIGSTFKGGFDNLDMVIQTLEECGFSHDRFYIHCDTALSGLMLPFIKEAQKITFKKPIGSVSVSGHKFLGSPMPCGVQLTRKKYVNILSKNVEYIGSLDATITGSRNGHAPIFMWYGLSIKGHDGLKKEVEECLKNAHYLKDRLMNAGISAMVNDLSITVVFERPLDHEFVRKWQLACEKNMAHVIVMPNVTTEILDNFVDNLIREREKWYLDKKIARLPCLAENIGISNCACPIHRN